MVVCVIIAHRTSYRESLLSDIERLNGGVKCFAELAVYQPAANEKHK